MKCPSPSLSSTALALLLALALSGPAAATTYQMMSDQALAEQASAIVQARIVGVEPAPTAGRPSTDYLVEVDRVLKGDLPGSTVVVRVPGGVGPDGIGLKIWGAPEFAEGEKALLFLVPAQDGTYRILHLMLGAFRERVVGGQRLALRDFSETREVGPQGLREGGADLVRSFDRFSDWIEDRSLGGEPTADYVVGTTDGKLGTAFDKYSFFTSSQGFNIRWFRFDTGGSVAWRVHQGGQPGLGLATTIEAFKVALEAWNSDPGSNIRYSYAGTTAAGGGLAGSDDVNAILFDDPYRNDPDEEVPGSFACPGGGVIAVGGPYFFLATRTFNGKRYHEAAEADIVTNDGTDCFFQNNRKVAEEVFAHELGHTLGIGHSIATPNALMWPNAHNDGRGARLDADDRAAVAVLYGNGTSGGGGKPPTAPKSLTARATSSTVVALKWRDRSNNEETFLVEQKVGRNWQQLESLPADATATELEGLQAGKSYTLRVRAANGAGATASNQVTVRMPARNRR